MMKIINIHQREYRQSIGVITNIFQTLSSREDLMWPHEKWPPMILDQGLNIDSSGGHGPIKYYVSQYRPAVSIEFTFVEPKEFHGIHRFELSELGKRNCRIKHTIAMDVSIKGILLWYLAIKWLHDALIEDCFDKIQNQISNSDNIAKWNILVKILRAIFRKKKIRT